MSREEATPRVTVVGIGNLLLRDEGVGIHIVRALQEAELPADVFVIDGGTSTDLIASLKAGRRLIIVDAAVTGGEPGDVRRFRPEELEPGRGALLSAHDIGVPQSLAMMDMAGNRPEEIVIIGIEPKEIGWGMELSPELHARLPELVGVILEEIRR